MCLDDDYFQGFLSSIVSLVEKHIGLQLYFRVWFEKETCEALELFIIGVAEEPGYASQKRPP
jgi:hypothetical protein